MDRVIPCTIGIGSNTADRESQVKKAIEYICDHMAECKVSSAYDSEAVSGDGTIYTNAVIHGRTNKTADQLVTFLKDYESMQGRGGAATAENGAGNVVIDLDLVIYDSRILRPRDFERHYFNYGYSELLADGAYID
ncbi:MAG: 2-amino-4-hydroxy-6-hydroxymethyldihydropteridine diphosphokinase, partial [Duncaniella sp.]|nr:2-amino-4-hydroxy-6-hydroxymethyldihydropteridine diphosphokinase [Duncaniella sp.]